MWTCTKWTLVAAMSVASVAICDDGTGRPDAVEWQKAFSKAKAALRAGRKDEAIAESARALKALGNEPKAVVERAQVLVFHGSALMQSARLAEARTSLKSASEILEKQRPGSYELAVCLLNLAEVEAQDGKPELADSLSGRSLAITKRWPNDDSRALTVLEGVCAVAVKLGKYRTAAKGALHSLALRRRTMVGSDPSILVRPLNIAAAGGYYLGDYQVAELCLREAIEICSHCFGDLHPATVDLRGNFLRTLSKAGKLGEAADVATACKQALEKLAKLGSASTLARLELALGEYEQARGKRAVAVKLVRAAGERLKGAGRSEHIEYADCQLLLGRMSIEDPRVARPALESAATIYVRARGPSNPKSILAKLWVLRANGARTDDTTVEARALLATLGEKIGDSHPDVVELAAWLKSSK